MKNTKFVAETALIAGLSIVLGYVESFFPALFSVPGIKLGLSNLAILFALYKQGYSSALCVMIIKVLISSLFFSGFQTFWFSASGGVLSLFAMCTSKKLGLWSIKGTSILGGIFHNLGQLISAAVILENTLIFSYFPVLLISGTVTGLLIGIVADLCISKTKKAY